VSVIESLIKRVPTAVLAAVAVLATVLVLWAGAATYQLRTEPPPTTPSPT
jgi:hypothetical protein